MTNIKNHKFVKNTKGGVQIVFGETTTVTLSSTLQYFKITINRKIDMNDLKKIIHILTFEEPFVETPKNVISVRLRGGVEVTYKGSWFESCIGICRYIEDMERGKCN